jgi:hypothetical protein
MSGRLEERARVIEDAITEVNLKINSDGSINVIPKSSSLESALTTFLTSREFTVSTTEVPILLLNNPSNSAKTVFLDLMSLSAITGGRIIAIRAYCSATITNLGTEVPSYSTVKKATPATAAAKLYVNPTVSANGNQNLLATSGQFQLSLPIKLEPIIVLSPGYNFLFTAITSGNNSTFALDLKWRELDAS